MLIYTLRNKFQIRYISLITIIHVPTEARNRDMYSTVTGRTFLSTKLQFALVLSFKESSCEYENPSPKRSQPSTATIRTELKSLKDLLDVSIVVTKA